MLVEYRKVSEEPFIIQPDEMRSRGRIRLIALDKKKRIQRSPELVGSVMTMGASHVTHE